ncbi:MAG: hypothetical protein ABFD54_16605 [Armatimonadota bacterium]
MRVVMDDISATVKPAVVFVQLPFALADNGVGGQCGRGAQS